MIQFGLVLALTSPLATFASESGSQPYSTQVPNQKVLLAQEIDFAARSLKYSSMTQVLDSNVIDKSISLLEKAKAEIDQGNTRTASDLIRRASLPLTQMSDMALAGRHPDPVRQAREVRDTVTALLPVARSIAAEKGAATDFVEAASDEVRSGSQLLAEGKVDAASGAFRSAYAKVSQRLAQLRSGDLFHIATPTGATSVEWRDGLRRIEERREISRYVEVEARSEGIDTSVLERGMQTAEALVGRATLLADQEKFDHALAHLENAYLAYEESWRSVGIEW
jgi:hypothetical protein